MVLILVIYRKIKKNNKKNKKDYYLTNLVSIGEVSDSDPLSLLSFDKVPYNTKRDIKSSAFSITGELGSGNFGKIFKGELTGLYSPYSKTIIAIKSVQGQENASALNDLIREIKLMSYINPHLNLVSMIGSCRSDIDDNGKLWLLLEFCEYGDLKEYLSEKKSIILSENEKDVINNRCLLKWSYDVCKGMKYLSESKIMHGDLAARNILLSENVLTGKRPVAKVADYGLSKKFYEDLTYEKTSRLFVPWKWMAIEYLNDDYFTLKSDVWSFGVLFWEMLSFGKSSYGHQEYEEVLSRLENGYRLQCPNEASKISSWNAKELYATISNQCFIAIPHSVQILVMLPKYLKNTFQMLK